MFVCLFVLDLRRGRGICLNMCLCMCLKEVGVSVHEIVILSVSEGMWGILYNGFRVFPCEYYPLFGITVTGVVDLVTF